MSTLYLKGMEQLWNGSIDVGADDFRLAFMSTSYTPNISTDQYFSDISASVASGTTVRDLTNVSVDIQSGNSRIVFDSDGVSEASVTTDTDKVVIYKWTGVASTSLLLACIDITEGTLSPINGTLELNPSANGWFGMRADNA